MGSYRLLVKRDAEKELRRLPRRDLKPVLDRIAKLASDPRPAGVEKLSTLERYRVRQGDFRVLYEIDDAARTITVVKVGHRRDAYR